MAQYQVTHSCGHDITHRLYGPHTDRDRRQQWLATVPCEECRKAAAVAAAQSANAAAGYAQLAGTPKQVAWAEQIRAELLPAAQQTFSDWVARRLADNVIAREVIDEAERAKLLSMFDDLSGGVSEYISGLAGESSAKWWIDNRHHRGEAMFDLVVLPVVTDRIDLLPLIRRPGLFSNHIVTAVDAAIAKVVAEEETAARQAAAHCDTSLPTEDDHCGSRPYYINLLRPIVGGGITVKIWEPKKRRPYVGDGRRVYLNRGRDAIACYQFVPRQGDHGEWELSDYTGDHADELARLCDELLRAEDGHRDHSNHLAAERLRDFEVPA